VSGPPPLTGPPVVLDREPGVVSGSEPAVIVEALVKSFGATTAVAGLSFSVARGEIYGLLGPNGAGKTTTLRILGGILVPTTGRARVAGLDVADSPLAVRRRLGFLTSTTGLYARLTGRELLAYFARLHGLDRAAAETRIATLARVLELGPFFGRRCEALSTGERQRLSIARAVLHDPEVLILDEPTAGLDVLASRFLRDFVRAERDRGKAVLFSTHYLAEAELLCDRIGLLHHGRLIAEGTPGSLRATANDAPSLEEAFLRLVGREGGRPGGDDDPEGPKESSAT
jgi:sodium transport system ATP-binding protein